MMIDEFEKDLERHMGKMAKFVVNKALLNMGLQREEINNTERILELIQILKNTSAISDDLYTTLKDKYSSELNVSGTAGNIKKKLPGVVANTPETLEESVREEMGQDDEADLSTVERFFPKPGDIILFHENYPGGVISEIIPIIKKEGKRAMCISRLPRSDFCDMYSIGECDDLIEHYWLSSIQTENSINPANLTKLLENIRKFISEEEGRIVYIEGIEYLITNTNFMQVLRMIERLNEVVKLHKARVIISMNLDTLEKKEKAFLEREVRIIQFEE